MTLNINYPHNNYSTPKEFIDIGQKPTYCEVLFNGNSKFDEVCLFTRSAPVLQVPDHSVFDPDGYVFILLPTPFSPRKPVN